MIASESPTVTINEEETSIDLRQYLALFLRWWWLILLAALLAGAAAFLVSRQMTLIYQASTTLLVNEAPANKTTDYASIMLSEQLAQAYAQMITKRPVMEEVVKRSGVSLTPEKLAGAVRVSPVRDTQLIVVSVQYTDPQLAANLANTIAQVFADQVMQNQATRSTASMESLQKQLSELDSQINQMREAIATAKASEEASLSEIAGLEAELNQYRINELEIQIGETSKTLVAVKIEEAKNRIEIERLETLLKQQQMYQQESQIKQTDEALALIRADWVENLIEISRLEARLNQYEQLYTQLLVDYGQSGASNPQSGEGKKNTLSNSPNNDLDKQINQTNDALSKAKANRDKILAEIEHLENRLSQYEQLYSNLSVSYEQLRLTEKQSTSSITQLESALVPRSPMSPKPMQNTMLAAIVGMMLAVGGIFTYDALDDTIKNPEEITRRFKLPILGVIARYDEPEDDQLITRAEPRSPVAEAFRALRTNVQYAAVDSPLRTLLVTSPSPADGKSSVTANLAVVIAQSGRRVAVIDADLHRPRVHHIFRAETRPGLSGLFVQPELHLNGSLQLTAQDGLRVVSSGEIPPNPSELLGSYKMREIIAAVLDQSDLVLLDTPPVLSLTDAVVLAPAADGVLLVLQPGETKLGALTATIEQLRRVNARLIGVVLNNVESGRAGYGYYYKRYYYKGYEQRPDKHGLGKWKKKKVKEAEPASVEVKP